MNEIRHIHLGRQAYTIAADAYTQLHQYLQDIKHGAGSDVAEEVELRIAELLAERGISGEKVILEKDVAYIKEQLGTPDDFSDDDSAAPERAEATEKRLFRDTDNAMIAGVAAGLGAYLDIDTAVIRIIFVILTLFGGSGILIYVVLWVLIPQTRTNSDKLQMRGLPVNVDNIKEAMRQADVEGAARRAGSLAVRGATRLARIALAVVGIGIVAMGVVAAFAAFAALAFGLARGVRLGDTIVFPVGAEETAVLACAVAAAVLAAAMAVVVGVALVRRRWTMPAWALAAVTVLFVAACAVASALAVTVQPTVMHRYNAIHHTRHVAIKPFTRLRVIGDNVFYLSEPGPSTDLQIRTLGTVNTNAIKVTENNGVLTVDTTHFRPQEGCHLLCPYGETNAEVYITTPDPYTIKIPSGGMSVDMPDQPMMSEPNDAMFRTGGRW